MAHKLLEFVQGDQASRVDRASCIIRDCKVLGERSKNPPPNNNVYPRSTREAALPMIDGLAVGINHPEKRGAGARRYEDFNGCLRKPYEDGHGIRAAWHLNPRHPLTEQILWDATENPANLAFSINAMASSRRQTPSGMIVEGIAHFESCDLVSRGATTNGLFESAVSLREWLNTPEEPAVRLIVPPLLAHPFLGGTFCGSVPDQRPPLTRPGALAMLLARAQYRPRARHELEPLTENAVSGITALNSGDLLAGEKLSRDNFRRRVLAVVDALVAAKIDDDTALEQLQDLLDQRERLLRPDEPDDDGEAQESWRTRFAGLRESAGRSGPIPMDDPAKLKRWLHSD